MKHSRILMKSSRSFSFRGRAALAVLLAAIWWYPAALQAGNHVFIVVIDGARYSETFGSKDRYIPRIWNELRPHGTIYTDFRNDGITKTCPGHGTLLTGVWQKIPNDGSQRCSNPTLFEFYRKQTGAPQRSCYVVSGKLKLACLTYGADERLGEPFGAAFAGTRKSDDCSTWDTLNAVLDRDHPSVVIINFPEVDLQGHANRWDGYLTAIRRADSLVGLLWKRIQSDSVYRSTTTMFVTNDHGRHDDAHGGIKSHGDGCDGCRHIMLLALGPAFKPGVVISSRTFQTDIAATAAEILELSPGTVGGHPLPRGEMQNQESR